jgi:multidrug efflux pump subunit AcrB
MAVSILFSAFLALSLTPALCATLLRRSARITMRSAASSAPSTGASSG